MRKCIDVVYPGHGVPENTFPSYLLGPFAVRMSGTAPSPCRIDVNVVRPGSTRLSRSLWPDASGHFGAVVLRWFDRADCSRLPLDPRVRVHWSFCVDEQVGISQTRVDGPGADETAAVKTIGLLSSAVEPALFREHYRHHVQLVTDHMPGIARYVQNDVLTSFGPHADQIVAISELCFRSQHDYDCRYVRGEQGVAEFRAQEGFLDLRRSITVSCVEHFVSLAAS